MLFSLVGVYNGCPPVLTLSLALLPDTEPQGERDGGGGRAPPFSVCPPLRMEIVPKYGITISSHSASALPGLE